MNIVHLIRARAVLAIVALACALLGLAVLLAPAGCHPQLPPVSGCTPHAMACRGDLPHVCSSSQRWEPAGDTTCAAVGGSCVISDAGVAFCAPLVDGGSDADR